MINFNFTINNPWSNRWSIIWFKNGLLPKHKAWEFNVYRTHYLVDVETHLTFKGDHAGFLLTIGLFGYAVEFRIYDTRHWNYEKDGWEIYDQK
jgi:hypothetical protein